MKKFEPKRIQKLIDELIALDSNTTMNPERQKRELIFSPAEKQALTILIIALQDCV